MDFFKAGRHMFPGNNTSVGFYSYYQYILPQQEANHIFCLKGGPGVGKSTFMKKIGERMYNEQLKVEYLHCSSDPDSLDGIVFPEIKIALIDGTAPHIIDPINPGAVDEIVNLGDFWNLDGIKQNKDRILQLNCEVKRSFKRAYSYISASKSLLDDLIHIYSSATTKAGPYVQAKKIIREVISDAPIGENLGRVKKQFASAITPSGIINYLDTLFDNSYKVFFILNNWGVGVNEFLQVIFEEAKVHSLDTELYYDPMDPEHRIDHIIIPKLKLAFISDSIFLSAKIESSVTVDMTQFTNYHCLDMYKDTIDFDSKTFQILLSEAVNTLNFAKGLHDEMESLYIPFMNFEKEEKN